MAPKPSGAPKSPVPPPKPAPRPRPPSQDVHVIADQVLATMAANPASPAAGASPLAKRTSASVEGVSVDESHADDSDADDKRSRSESMKEDPYSSS